MSNEGFALTSPICEFCGSKNTKFIVSPNGSIHVKCSDCMRVYDMGARGLSDVIPTSTAKTVVADTKQMDIVDIEEHELVKCEYRLPCGVCKLLERPCLEDTDASKS